MGAKTTISVLEGNNFVVSDLRGDIDASPTEPLGLFAWDTRFLSRWLLMVDEQRPNVLSTDDLDYFYVQFFLVPGTGTVYVDSDLSIIRKRAVGKTVITASAGADIDEHGLSFAVHIEPHGEWTTSLDVVAVLVGIGENHQETTQGRNGPQARSEMKRSLEKLGEALPQLSCDWPSLQVTYRQGLIDLAALRFFPVTLPGQALPAAGLPWFMTLFGRDSIIVSYQALPFTSQLAEATLRALAEQQGTRVDDFRDEEPGKIMHEARFGEMTAFEERPHSPYYGSADATPLCDGYVEYSRRNTETGLENQCWKDSWNSILFADGTLSRLPRATCEIQGYVYDARMRCARLAREFWHDSELADRLESQAAELKRRFNQDFWLEDRAFFALALDGDGRKVDALTSNIGHLLWSGIVDEDKAEAVVRHLMGPQLYSGWGVRTMAEGEGGYNPIGYHLGTVWPHDNAFIAMGLRRYGYREEAARVAMNMLEAASYFKGRLPEAFAGYSRVLTEFPVEYPTACSPQAWASGAPLLLLRAILGLEPVGDNLLVDPAIPSMLGRLELLDIPGRWGRIDAFGRGRVETSTMRGSTP